MLNRSGDIDLGKKELLVCAGTGCMSSKSLKIIENLEKAIKDNGLDIDVHGTGCFGFCGKGPIVKIMPDDTFYSEVSVDDAEKIVSHLAKDEIYEEKLFINPDTKVRATTTSEIPFYNKQVRLALKNCGFVNAESIDDYIGAKGYQALALALEKSPQEIIDIIKESGIRGRGGGGFSTGLKWEFAFKNESDQKYVVCNADEGDPGAFMDRSILEGDPHSVIEAMAICGYAIGASEGYVYIRAEYPVAYDRLVKAIKVAREEGLLGKNILGSSLDFDILIKFGAGAFVCGEETALISSMEGKRGEPTSKPPFPAEKGFWKKPTNVNNVETLANIPQIILNGADWFSKIGTEKSSGTKVFALAGKINNVGLVEVPMGTTLREVIYDIGGGIVDGKKFKAVQTGGPSGGCLTEEDLDTPIDFDSLIQKGSMMGSGGMIVMDEDDCMVSVAKFFLEFTEEESCGKCTPCRIGTKRLLEVLVEITEGRGNMKHIEELRRLCTVIKETSLCGLGQSAPNPILSTLEKFENEYIEHIKKKKCRAHSCNDLIQYLIDVNECVGCTACKKVCPTSCISGEVKKIHSINQENCIKCGACKSTCRFNAIVVR
ncbi:NADH-quinone oxidoreductase subunit NuoF [Mycoplasmatota bacterium zrk1]